MNQLIARGMLRVRLISSIAMLRNVMALLGLSVLTAFIWAPDCPQATDVLRHWFFPSTPGAEQTSFFTGALSVPGEKVAIMLGLNDDSPSADGEAAGEATPAVGGVTTPRSDARVVKQSAAMEQAAISHYLARKYRVNNEALDLMVNAAFLTGEEVGIDPSLLLAVIAIESGFNPFAESMVGAQGLMQVMSHVHEDKMGDYGGVRAALNPVANIRVGAVILKDCLRKSGGSIKGALRLYAGSTSGADGSYGVRVLLEKERIDVAAHGGNPQLVSAPSTLGKPADAGSSQGKSANSMTAGQRTADSVKTVDGDQGHDKVAAL